MHMEISPRGTVQQAGRSWVEYLMRSFDFFQFLPATLYGPGVDSASNRNEYQESSLGIKSDQCIRLTTLLPPVN
jgi:hypothetical protein